MKRKLLASFAPALIPALVVSGMLAPTLSFGSVESSLLTVQARLINTILPLAGILGLVFAGLSFVMGHENARGRLILAITGAVIGFMAPSIISFIQSMVN